jgi:hypothetical protein
MRQESLDFKDFERAGWTRARTRPDVRWNTRASAAVAESVAQMRALPLQRLLVAHAYPIAKWPRDVGLRGGTRRAVISSP